MEFGIIYKCTCLTNNKFYIGKTVKKLEDRKRQHIVDSKRYRLRHIILYRAFKKYGLENFKWDVLCVCPEDHLNKVEISYIKQFKSLKPNGYNMTTGGDGRPKGYKVSEETRRKIGLSKIGNKNTFGRKHTEESKKKMSEAQKGKIFTEEHKRNLKKARKGIVFSEEHRKNLGISGRKNYIVITPDGREIKVNGLVNFCRDYKEEKLNACNMNLVANGKRKHHKGYKCVKMPQQKS